MSLNRDESRDGYIAVYQATFQHVLAYCRRRTSTADDAEDAVAEVYLVAWCHKDELGNLDSEVAWLLGVARRVVANQQRSRRRQERLSALLASLARQSETDDPAKVLEAHAGAASLHAALDRLSSKDREIVMLYALEELTYHQIGQVVDLSPAAVRSRLYRARQAMVAHRSPSLRRRPLDNPHLTEGEP